mgnify:CR=1 FL=1
MTSRKKGRRKKRIEPKEYTNLAKTTVEIPCPRCKEEKYLYIITTFLAGKKKGEVIVCADCEEILLEELEKYAL